MHVYPHQKHPDVEVAELEQCLVDLKAADNLTDRERAGYQDPLERKLERARAHQAYRHRLDTAAEAMSARELAAQVPR